MTLNKEAHYMKVFRVKRTLLIVGEVKSVSV